jgi:hypothetical protein
MKFRVFWDVLPCSQIDVDLMMEATRTSETSADIDFRTWQTSQKTLNFIIATART